MDDLRSLSEEEDLEISSEDSSYWWEARFDTITLEDRNLPEIAARRVLRINPITATTGAEVGR